MTPQEIEELSWRMGEVYEAVVNRILVNLARHFRYIEAGEIPSGAWEYQVKKLAEMGQINRETERIILEMLGDADSALQALLKGSILNGLRDAEPALRSAAEKGFLSGGSNIPPVLAPNQMQAFRAFYAQSADKLNLVNTVMLESTQAAFAATVSDIAVKIANTQGILNVASGEVVTGVSAWNKAMRDAVNKMVENGLTGYIDHAGRHWSPEAYVTMDIRSTMANTARAAVFERNEEYGNDLYQVSWHNGARPLCYPWQGKVISHAGNARMVEDDEGNEVQVHTEDEIESFNYGGGLFGVNCGHYPIPFIPGFSRIRQPMQDAEQNAKTYEESQKQRTLERKLRNEKRDLEVLKAQGASEDVLKEQRRRVRKASKDIDEFCAETGRARRRNREYTPIDPKFPDPDTYDPKLFPNDEKNKIDNWFRNGDDTQPPMVNIHAGGDDVPPARTFTPAQSIDEAEAYFSKMCNNERFGAIGVSFDGVSLDVANKVNETIGGLYEEYKVDPFGGIKAPKGNTKLGQAIQNATAAYSPPRHSFLLNRKSLGTIEKADAMFRAETDALRDILNNPQNYDLSRLRPSVKEVIERSKLSGRATVPNNIQEALTHEFGHALQRSVKMHPDWSTVKANIPQFAERISGYACYSIDEYIAESFASYTKGETVCDPALIKIFKSLRR